MKTVRQLALELLLRGEGNDAYLNLAIDGALKHNPMQPADRGLLTTLVYGVTEKKRTLDAAIDSLCVKKNADVSADVRNALRMGIYQMAYLDRVPDHAAVNETVALVPKHAKGFVNAILREFGRRGKVIPLPDAESDPVRYLAVRDSFSDGIAEAFIREFGLQRAGELLASFSIHPALTVRTNTLKTDRKALLAAFRAAGFDAAETNESQSGIRVTGNAPVVELPGFADGWFFVQDEASQLAVEALDARKGMTVLDLCACPGSKSFGAAIEMRNTGRVISGDLHRNKLSLIESGAERLGISNLTVRAGDARVPVPEFVGIADRVLCDVPCSGFGVFAKKPELRYKDPATCAELPNIQFAILNTACTYVKQGGRLVYSTCTLLPDENERNIERFLAAHGEFSLCRTRTLTPVENGTDGFFFAVLEKNG